eukprot:4172808-Pyramimonas_sp.AAC.1
MEGDTALYPLNVRFIGEPGVDAGPLLTYRKLTLCRKCGYILTIDQLDALWTYRAPWILVPTRGLGPYSYRYSGVLPQPPRPTGQGTLPPPQFEDQLRQGCIHHPKVLLFTLTSFAIYGSSCFSNDKGAHTTPETRPY